MHKLGTSLLNKFTTTLQEAFYDLILIKNRLIYSLNLVLVLLNNLMKKYSKKFGFLAEIILAIIYLYTLVLLMIINVMICLSFTSSTSSASHYFSSVNQDFFSTLSDISSRSYNLNLDRYSGYLNLLLLTLDHYSTLSINHDLVSEFLSFNDSMQNGNPYVYINYNTDVFVQRSKLIGSLVSTCIGLSLPENLTVYEIYPDQTVFIIPFRENSTCQVSNCMETVWYQTAEVYNISLSPVFMNTLATSQIMCEKGVNATVCLEFPIWYIESLFITTSTLLIYHRHMGLETSLYSAIISAEFPDSYPYSSIEISEFTQDILPNIQLADTAYMHEGQSKSIISKFLERFGVTFSFTFPSSMFVLSDYFYTRFSYLLVEINIIVFLLLYILGYAGQQ